MYYGTAKLCWLKIHKNIQRGKSDKILLRSSQLLFLFRVCCACKFFTIMCPIPIGHTAENCSSIIYLNSLISTTEEISNSYTLSGFNHLGNQFVIQNHLSIHSTAVSLEKNFYHLQIAGSSSFSNSSFPSAPCYTWKGSKEKCCQHL